jgi:hypothetical protein
VPSGIAVLTSPRPRVSLEGGRSPCVMELARTALQRRTAAPARSTRTPSVRLANSRPAQVSGSSMGVCGNGSSGVHLTDGRRRSQ